MNGRDRGLGELVPAVPEEGARTTIRVDDSVARRVDQKNRIVGAIEECLIETLHRLQVDLDLDMCVEKAACKRADFVRTAAQILESDDGSCNR